MEQKSNNSDPIFTWNYSDKICSHIISHIYLEYISYVIKHSFKCRLAMFNDLLKYMTPLVTYYKLKYYIMQQYLLFKVLISQTLMPFLKIFKYWKFMEFQQSLNTRVIWLNWNFLTRLEHLREFGILDRILTTK